MKLTAAWNTDSSTISYETNGGTINDDNVNYRHLLGDSEGLPYNVTKPGYVSKDGMTMQSFYVMFIHRQKNLKVRT